MAYGHTNGLGWFSPGVSTSTLRSSNLFVTRNGPFRIPIRRPMQCGSGGSPQQAQRTAFSNMLTTCGAPGSMDCNMGSPKSSFQGLGGLGRLGRLTSGLCSKLDSVLDRIENALAEARRVGVDQQSAGYVSASKFFDRETSFWQWNRTDPILPSTCDRVAAEGEAALNALNASVDRGGGMVIGKGTPDSGDTLYGAVKWVAIAGVAIAGAVVLGPPIAAIFGRRR